MTKFLENNANDERKGDSLIVSDIYLKFQKYCVLKAKNAILITKRIERVLGHFDILAQGWTPQGLRDQIENEGNQGRLKLTKQALQLTARVEAGVRGA